MRRLILPIGLFLILSSPVYAQTPFYQGKQIKVVVGFTSSGFYDRWARLLSRFMPKHIPGSPEMIVQNMPGAGSVVATNFVYGVAKPDGLTIGFPSSAIYLDQLIGRAEAKFDIRKFNWIGSPVQEPVIFYIRADSPYKSISDIRNAKEPPKCGATGTVSTDFILARFARRYHAAAQDRYGTRVSRRRRDRPGRRKKRGHLPRHDRLAVSRP